MSLQSPIQLVGPISGYPDGNREAFTEAAHRLRLQGFRVYNPRAMPSSDACADEAIRLGEDYRSGPMYQEAMRECYRHLLEQARAVVVLPCWWRSNGASREVLFAETLGLPVFDSEYLLPLSIQFEKQWHRLASNGDNHRPVEAATRW